MLILLTEYNASVFHSSGCQPEKVSIIGA